MGWPIASEEASMNIFAFFVVAAAITLNLVLYERNIKEIAKRRRRLRRSEAKLDRLMKNAGLDPYIGLPDGVADALNRGEKLKAIQLYRSATRVSLKEAKDFIEHIMRRSGP
jgi:hypothetical protein